MARDLERTPTRDNTGTPTRDNTVGNLENVLADFIAAQTDGQYTSDDVHEKMNSDEAKALMWFGQYGGEALSSTMSDGLKYGTASGMKTADPTEGYMFALEQASRARTDAEKEQWNNIAAQYQSQIMRDYDNQYNTASAQVERLMAAGMSRQAAMAVLQGSNSEGQVAGVQNAAPTELQQGLNQAQQIGEMASSAVSFASGVNSLRMFPHLLRGAKSQADLLTFAANNQEYEQEGRVLANHFSNAAYASGRKKAEIDGVDFDPTTIRSLADAKKLIEWGASNGVVDAIMYNNKYRPMLEGNLYGQSLCQKGYDGWVSTKDYDPMEDTWDVMNQAYKDEARTRSVLYNNASLLGMKTQAEINNIDSEQRTKEYILGNLLPAQVGNTKANTALVWSQKKWTDIAEMSAELDYDVKFDWSDYQCAYYNTQCSLLRNLDKGGYFGTEASRILNDTKWQDFMVSQRFLYAQNPEAYRASHLQPNGTYDDTYYMVVDAAGTFNAWTNYNTSRETQANANMAQTKQHYAPAMDASQTWANIGIGIGGTMGGMSGYMNASSNMFRLMFSEGKANAPASAPVSNPLGPRQGRVHTPQVRNNPDVGFQF